MGDHVFDGGAHGGCGVDGVEPLVAVGEAFDCNVVSSSDDQNAVLRFAAGNTASSDASARSSTTSWLLVSMAWETDPLRAAGSCALSKRRVPSWQGVPVRALPFSMGCTPSVQQLSEGLSAHLQLESGRHLQRKTAAAGALDAHWCDTFVESTLEQDEARFEVVLEGWELE